MNPNYLLAAIMEPARNKTICIKADTINIASFFASHQETPLISIETLDD